MKKKSAQLFDGADENNNADNVQLKVNDDFARRLQVSCDMSQCCRWHWPGDDLGGAFALPLCNPRRDRSPVCCVQHNKQREELHRLQQRHPKEAAKAAQRVFAQQQSEGEEDSSDEDEVSELRFWVA